MNEFFTVCPRNCFGSCRLRVQIKNGHLHKVSPGGGATGHMVCKKAIAYPEYVHSLRRVMRPMLRVGPRGGDCFAPISWSSALDFIWNRLTRLKEIHGARSILLLEGSGNLGILRHSLRCFWTAFGGCSETYGDLCDSAAQETLKMSLGSVKMNAAEDIEKSRLIILWGKNPIYTHPQVMPHINRALQNGGRLVTIDPRHNESSSRSSLYIQPMPGTDEWLALGLGKMLVERRLIDRHFLDSHVNGTDAYISFLEREIDIRQVEQITGVSESQLEQLVKMFEDTKDIAVLCGSGLQRYPNGGLTIHSILSVSVLLGAIGKPGRGFYYNDKQSPILRWPYSNLENNGLIEPRFHVGSLGKELSETPERIRGAWITQSNPLVSHPDRNAVEKQFALFDFIAVSDLFVTETARFADIILPATSFIEYADLIRGYGHSYIQYQPRIIAPLGESVSCLELTKRIMERFGFDPGPLALGEEALLEDILRASGIGESLEDLSRRPYLSPDYKEIAYENGIFDTPSGKIELLSPEFETEWGINPLSNRGQKTQPVDCRNAEDGKFPFVLVSSHSDSGANSQFSHITGLEITPLLSMNPMDAQLLNLNDGAKVEVSNARGSVNCSLRITNAIRPAVLHLFFGTWSGSVDVTVNRLTSGGITDLGQGTAFHNCRVAVHGVIELP